MECFKWCLVKQDYFLSRFVCGGGGILIGLGLSIIERNRLVIAIRLT